MEREEGPINHKIGSDMVVKNEKGQFAKGHGEKPRGALNKITLEQKERVEWVLELLDETLEENIAMLKPKEKVDLWLSLQEYIRPKLQWMNVDLGPAQDKLTKVTFEVINSSVLPEGTGNSLTGREDVKESPMFKKN